MWYVYLLKNEMDNRTYIGCTTDYTRRLKQHRGELKGGARSTLKNKGGWVLHQVLSGFSNRSEAMRWEKIVKSRCRGLNNRVAAFHALAAGICPGKGKQYSVPENIYLTFKG